MSASTWNDDSNLPGGPYSASNIQKCIECIKNDIL